MPDYDCQTCGACCLSHWDTETYVYVSDRDIRRLRMAYTEPTVRRLVGGLDDPLEQGIRTKENEQGQITCISLRGSVGRQCSCGIYEARPKVCRDFNPGSEACKYAREEARITAQRT